ncbi:MAG: DNA primase [Betaproteobacteria bacterium RIFCSPHIGHO2_12_FULL_69_13]|nr:MAG: DNA primase [Betaproteobacteria bacterium RIFCSPHIGHO2_12_FULL_69_13]
MIPDSFKQDLLNRVDIVEVVSRYVRLKKGGANHLGLCPFHAEKTPSFAVSPAKQFYHCFGCGAHGNAIGFLMAYAGLGYVDAVRDLAGSVGMQVPEWRPRTPEEAARQERETDLYGVMEKAMEFYRSELKKSPRAIEYLKGRGLSGEIAARFRIGYAPDDWQALRTAFPGYEDKALVECGLVVENEGKRYDRFRDRVIFPILSARGLVIGFGGRVIGEGEPKYLNSPETPIFEKGRELYGLAQARDAIRSAGRALVVEGYLDAVALAQFGVGYAVATLGTATTPVHVSKLLRLADELVFCFDGDAAGRKAAWRALEVSLPLAQDHKPIRFLFLPEGEDPDSYVRSRGAEALEKLVRGAQTLSEFLIGGLRAQSDLATPEGRSGFLAAAKPYMQGIAAAGLQLQVLKEMAGLARVSQDEAETLLELRKAPSYARRAPAPVRAPTTTNLEWKLLRFLLLRPQRASELDLALVDPNLPESAALAAFAAWCRDAAPPERVEHALLIERFAETPHAPLLFEAQQSLLELRLTAEEADVEIENCLRGLRVKRTGETLEALRRRVERGEAGREELAEYSRKLREFEEMKRGRSEGRALL